MKKNNKNKIKKNVEDPKDLFSDWWSKVAQKKVDKIEKTWLKGNEPNDPDEDGGGDHWHVNEMMHNGDASEMTAEIAEEIFLKGYNGEEWIGDMSDSLFCDLDEVISLAYEAGKNLHEQKEKK